MRRAFLCASAGGEQKDENEYDSAPVAVKLGCQTILRPAEKQGKSLILLLAGEGFEPSTSGL
jgi:hypothetical protein